MKRSTATAISVLMCAVAIQLPSTSAHAQRVGQLQIQVDRGGFASFSNFSLGSRSIQGGRELPELTFEISIDKPPSCPYFDNLALYYDLLSPSGAYIEKQAMSPGIDELKNVRQGERRVARIASARLKDAGTIRISIKCSAIR
jgi:hypothetical protein